jgi:hypothetical protein
VKYPPLSSCPRAPHRGPAQDPRARALEQDECGALRSVQRAPASKWLAGSAGSRTIARLGLRSVLAELTQEREWRLVKAANIVDIRDIVVYHGIGWLVGSECDATKACWVQPIDGQMTCDCMDYRQRGGPGKHALAVELYQRCERRDAEQDDPTGSVIPFPAPTYDPDRDRFELTAKGYAYLAGDEFYTGA